MKLKSRIIISLMGVDGSGKTKLSKKINKLFINSKYLHLKPYIFFLDRRTVVKNPYALKKSSTLFSLIRLISWLISYKIFFYKNKCKKIYIFDRYAHDIAIDPIRYQHRLSSNLTNFILGYFPKPDLWIFLNASKKTIKSRKNELSESELNLLTKKYSIFFKNQKNVLKLNTNTLIKKSILQIKKKMKPLFK